MRKSILCVVQDLKCGTFGSPCVFSSEGEAERCFFELCSDKSTVVGKYPADFRMVKIGDYDFDAAVVFPCEHLVVCEGFSSVIVGNGKPLGLTASND